MRYNAQLGQWNTGTGFGDILHDPIVPPLSGGQFVKFAVVAGVGIWLLSKLAQAFSPKKV